MTIARPFLTGFLAAAITFAPASPTLFAQPQRAAPPEESAIILYSAGIEAAWPSPHDAFLREHLPIIARRLAELPADFGVDDSRVKPLNAQDIATVLLSPMSLRFNMGPTPESEEYLPLLTFVSRPADAKVAERLSNAIRNWLTAEGIDYQRTTGTARIRNELGITVVGNRGEAFVIAMNTEFDQLPSIPEARGLPENSEPTSAFTFDPRPLQPFFENVLIAENPDPQAIREVLTRLGLLGENTIKVESATTQLPDRLIGFYREIGSAPVAANFGFTPDLTLGTDILNLVPADATALSALVFDLEPIYDNILWFLQQANGQQPPIEQWLRDNTGIDLSEDLFAALGKRIAAYQSPSTGGGSLASTVAVVEIADADAMRRLLDKISQNITEQIAPLTRATVSIRQWELLTGETAWSLSFPSIPAPIEPSWTIYENKWLIKAATPTTLQAAIDLLSDQDRTTFASNEHLLAEANSDASDALLIHYLDSAFYAQRGYGLLNIGAAAISNFVQARGVESRIGESRIPTYNTLMRNLRPTIAVAKWQGDDLLYTFTANPSATSHIAALLGSQGPLSLSAGLALPAFSFATAMPAMSRARESAQQIRSASNIRQMLMGLMSYAADHNDSFADSLQTLVENDILTPDMLQSVYGPAWDGGSDFAYRTDLAGKRMADIQLPATTILIVDRAALLAGIDRINVGFADAHVEALTQWELARKLQEPGNQGAAEALGIADLLPN